MPKNRLITGLDIGTDSLKALTVLNRPGSSDFEVIGQVQEPVFGMRKGVVANREEVSKYIQGALARLQDLTGQKVEEVFLNIDGGHLFSTPSHGTVIVSRADQRISEEDVQRAIQAAQAFSLPSNKEILDVFPKQFIVDGEGGIKEPRGMQGIRLEAEILALGVFSPYLKNLTQATLNAGYQIADIIPSPLASARACLSCQQKELGVIIVDIGAGTTGLAVYQEGDLIHAAVFPMGSNNVTNDIAIGLQIDIDLAERIKREFGSCILTGADKRETIEAASNEGPLIFSHKILTGIIGARISEIFGEINKELKRVFPKLFFPGGVVLTGGGSKLPKIVDLAKKELKLPVRKGVPTRFLGLNEDPSLSTACGLVLHGFDLEETEVFSNFRKGIASKVKRIFKTFIP